MLQYFLSDTLDDLQAMVLEIFGNVPNRPCKKPDLREFTEPFGAAVFNKIFKGKYSRLESLSIMTHSSYILSLRKLKRAK